jgi:hypothetical protein
LRAKHINRGYRKEEAKMKTYQKSLLLGALGISFAMATSVGLARTIVIDDATFDDDPTMIDNPYLPISGSVERTFWYLGASDDECELNKMTVLESSDPDGSRSILGVAMRVVRDQAWIAEMDEETGECDFGSAELHEDTLDYFAQDDAGNIWYYGEDTLAKEDDGSCTEAGAWLAGDNGAKQGILMLAQPKSGDRYQQEFDEGNAEDWAAVLRLNGSVAIDDVEYEECLITKEWTPLEPGQIEHKYYCPSPEGGPGLVYIRELKEKTVEVAFIGNDSPLQDLLPGEDEPFPAVECLE